MRTLQFPYRKYYSLRFHRFVLLWTIAIVFSCASQNNSAEAFKSIDTGFSILKVRTAKTTNGELIIASSYEGTILALDYDGNKLWENDLSGFMNHDMWCDDMNKDGDDEILLANADGAIYCLNSKGQLLWDFKPNEAPMYAVCTVKKNEQVYVVGGGYDKSIYYLDVKGQLVKEVSSYNYSRQSPWKYSKPVPDSTCHIANFIRPVKNPDGSVVLAVHGVIHTMAVVARGLVYFFEPLTDNLYEVIDLGRGGSLGEMRVFDADGDNYDELYFGTSTLTNAHLVKLDVKSKQVKVVDIDPLRTSKDYDIDNFGYRIVRPELILEGEKHKIFALYGSNVLLFDQNPDNKKVEVLTSSFSFNDHWKSGTKMILASAQSGGSAIHILDLENSRWKSAYENIQPIGKLKHLVSTAKNIRNNLDTFKALDWERKPLPVYLMSEARTKEVQPIIENIKKSYNSPIFLNSGGTKRAEKTERNAIKNQKYFNRRDDRRIYNATSKEIVEAFKPLYKDEYGTSFWGGHGNDPYMIRLNTIKNILDLSSGQKTVLIYPELEDHSEDFAYVMDDYFYPLAEYSRKKNAMIYVRTKHTHWSGAIYEPMWERLMSGEFSDVFIPSMEETSDKSMEIGLAGRLGVWASGATDAWGSRCARDNPSFDRLREHSHQKIPNHFLRNMVYHVSLGAQYLDNFSVDQNYMSVLWELIAKGALYVPKRNEILSFSPVHLSMKRPDSAYLDRTTNVKWTTFYDPAFEKANPFVFSRLDGSWPGAPNTPWDFSAYASGVADRRADFLPEYINGIVLITPPQNGVFAKKGLPRGNLKDNLHPWYKSILKEYVTDGRYYYSKDGTQKFSADEYYKIIKEDIQASSKKLPITVTGGVAWVVAQSAPNHLRLTLIDGGYLNPNTRIAKVKFQSIDPIFIKDILNNESFQADGNTVAIPISCGGFRFLDIELKDNIKSQ